MESASGKELYLRTKNFLSLSAKGDGLSGRNGNGQKIVFGGSLHSPSRSLILHQLRTHFGKGTPPPLVRQMWAVNFCPLSRLRVWTSPLERRST